VTRYARVAVLLGTHDVEEGLLLTQQIIILSDCRARIQAHLIN